MSRFILVPAKAHDSDNSDTFLLIPTEGINGQIKNVDLPKGLVPNFLRKQGVKDRKLLGNLLIKMSKAEIGRSKDGLLTIGSKVLDTKFDDFVLDSCNGKFLECYEDIYCVLRRNGITF